MGSIRLDKRYPLDPSGQILARTKKQTYTQGRRLFQRSIRFRDDYLQCAGL